ncbi:Hypothetical protein ABZS17D1_03971 [Kosakonia cowanii]
MKININAQRCRDSGLKGRYVVFQERKMSTINDYDYQKDESLSDKWKMRTNVWYHEYKVKGIQTGACKEKRFSAG